MKRRRFLAAAGTTALLAGCPAREVADETPTVTPIDGTTTPEPTGDGDVEELAERLREGPNVHAFENVPLTVSLHGGMRSGGSYRSEDGLSAVFGMTEPATEESPATVRAVLRNEREYEQTFRLRRVPGFDSPSRGRRDAGEHLYLAPTGNHDLAESTPDVAPDDDGRWRLASVPGDSFPETLTLAPEEAVGGEYHLVGSHNVSTEALVAGTYDFQGFTLTAWPTDSPGPDDDSEFSGTDVPALPQEGEMAWFHDADASTQVYLQPSSESVETPACIEYELYNRSHEEISGNPYDWGLYKLTDGEWFRVEPWAVPAPLSYVQPGDSDESSLGVYHGDPVECDEGRAVGHLGGGRYAHRVGFGREGETHAALFDLAAPVVEPEPDPDVDVERDGGELVVTMPEWHDDEHPPRAEIVFEQSDADPDRRLIPEQLFRRPMRGHRNALPLFDESVERLRLRADRHVVGDTVNYDELKQVVRYEGETYRVEGEDPLRD